MVERTEKQNSMGSGIAVGQVARVANFRRRERMFGLPNRSGPRLLQAFRDRIQKMHLITARG
jgi:hypothetical protein